MEHAAQLTDAELEREYHRLRERILSEPRWRLPESERHALLMAYGDVCQQLGARGLMVTAEEAR